MEILKVQNLCKTYGKGEARVDALKNVSFALEKGEFAAVVGESGSGKSTLLNCIGALDAPSSGSVTIEGQNLHTMKEEERTIFRRRNIGFIFQSFQLVSELTVEQNIIFPILLDYRKPNAQDVKEILDMLGLTERRSHLPNQLSGGQQQRVAIGRALITRPKLILADEPTGNLDSKNSQDVMDLLTQASRHYQQTILMITHSLLYQFYTFMQNMSCTNKSNFFIFVSDCCYIICHYTSPLSYSYTDKKVKYQKENNNSQESKESSFQN